MTVCELLTEALKANDFDGLYNSDMECGCKLDDLCPCGNPDADNCVGGYKRIAEDGEWEGHEIVGPKKE